MKEGDKRKENEAKEWERKVITLCLALSSCYYPRSQSILTHAKLFCCLFHFVNGGFPHEALFESIVDCLSLQHYSRLKLFLCTKASNSLLLGSSFPRLDYTRKKLYRTIYLFLILSLQVSGAMETYVQWIPEQQDSKLTRYSRNPLLPALHVWHQVNKLCTKC